MDFFERCLKSRASLLCYVICAHLLFTSDSAKIRFPSVKPEQTIIRTDIEPLIPCNGSILPNFVYNINGVPCSVASNHTAQTVVKNTGSTPSLVEEEGSKLWQRYNLSEWKKPNPLQTDDGHVFYESSTVVSEFEMVPVHSNSVISTSQEQLISENDVASLQNQYRWVIDKPAIWKKRYGNASQANSNALVDAFKNKTKPVKATSYSGQKGFQNEFLDILGKGEFHILRSTYLVVLPRTGLGRNHLTWWGRPLEANSGEATSATAFYVCTLYICEKPNVIIFKIMAVICVPLIKSYAYH